eukprot:m51a1_g14791 hypothetical protein (914) ;mRNA; r:505443-511802
MKLLFVLAIACATMVWGYTGDATFYGATGPVVKIVDKCPKCRYGDLDLSPDAFARIVGAQSIGRHTMSWTRVACPVSGNLHYEAMHSSPLLLTALNGPQWANSALCGTCAKVTGPAGSAVVKIVDECPGCKYGDLDLSPDAFTRIVGPLGIGRHTVSWTRVRCPVSGKLQYKTKPGANNWWVALQVRNHPVGVAKLEIKESGSSTWINMDRTDYNYFARSFASASGIRLPASVRVTACNGQQVVDNNIIRAINSSAVTAGTVQFSNLNPFEPMTDSPLLATAINNPQWANSALCGTCANVTGPAGSAVLKIMDKCFECLHGDLDMSPDAFSLTIGALSIGRHTMSWTRVVCPVSGNLQYKTKVGANPWWVALQVRNHPVGVTKLEIRESGSSTWIDMGRTDYNYFVPLSLAVGRLPPFRGRALLFDLLSRICCSASPFPAAAAASVVGQLASRPHLAAVLVPPVPERRLRRLYVYRECGGPLECEAEEVDDTVDPEAPRGGNDYWSEEEDEADDSDYSDNPDDDLDGHQCPAEDDHCHGPPPKDGDPHGRPIREPLEDILEPVRRMRADPRSALAVALRCCSAAVAAREGAGTDGLAAALEGVGSALAPEGACPGDLGDCLPLVCSLGSSGLLRCLGDAIGPERAAAAASGRHLACIACASGDAAEVLRVLAQQPFCLGREDALRGHLSCQMNKFVPGESIVGRWVFAHRPCDVHGDRLLPIYTLCAACANDDADALAALAEPPYSLDGHDALSALGSPDWNNESVESVLALACVSNSAAAVRVLARPPYSLTGACDCGLMGLQRACEAGSVDVLDALAEPPWNMGRNEALDVLRTVIIYWSTGTVATLRRLREQPYCITWEGVVWACDGRYDPELMKLFGATVGPEDKVFVDVQSKLDRWSSESQRRVLNRQ